MAANRDDTAALVTLTAREIAPKAKIVASIREAETSICCGSRARTRWWFPPKPLVDCSGLPPPPPRRGDDRGSTDAAGGVRNR
ncbi:hypothetical protein I553_0126 [Mycobacterium xenopi 4042]|uniref:Uncharacterized protein n=1 Tax=Mycobacterium xenopi 4042 TaxID=1299334 RepID=X7YIK4_MYCXE|nr:hypothetical protein I553_0126 [Mycobacterium xenopi 4042]